MTQHSSLWEDSMDGRALTPVLENYLEIIFLEEAREGAARASSIADAASVSRSTVTSTLKTLRAMGLVEYEPYSLIHLTSRGRAVGREIAHRHIIFREFFLRVLQLEEQQADAIACELEHVVPSDVVQRWGQFVLYLTSHESWKTWQEEYRANREQFLQRMDNAFALPESRAEQIQKAERTQKNMF